MICWSFTSHEDIHAKENDLNLLSFYALLSSAFKKSTLLAHISNQTYQNQVAIFLNFALWWELI
jgi:hypothetical protein